MTLPMAKKYPATAVLSPEPDQDVIVFDAADELTSRPSLAPSEDDVKAKIREADAEMEAIRQRKEEFERQKQHLENIRHKQELFGKGKREMLERLTQDTMKLEGELYHVKKLAQELDEASENYSSHLDALRALQSDRWQGPQIEQELDLALSVISEAEADHAKWSRRLRTLRPEVVEQSPAAEQEEAAAPLQASDDLLMWAKRGFAFTLPLIGAIMIALVLARLMF